ncbi:hypothetical protein [Treponema primitia]|uniref:hypothetical protein n=1 Tax=Treponema primitia TaxID=88058 RepID=UPI0002555884|nr:hypothetical protein [Treponema primitia]
MDEMSHKLSIHSLALAFNKAFIRNIEEAHGLNINYPAYRLLYYGNTGILVIAGVVLNPIIPILTQIANIFIQLIHKGILYPNISITDLRIHELELRYTFLYYQPFLCKSSGFRKVGNRYLSRDYRKYYRTNGELKETRKSFLCIESHNNSSSVIFNITGKKRQYLCLSDLTLTIPQLFCKLMPLLSCFLSQATNPFFFNINHNYLPYLCPDFIAILRKAGWFNNYNRFVKKRVHNFNPGGPLC